MATVWIINDCVFVAKKKLEKKCQNGIALKCQSMYDSVELEYFPASNAVVRNCKVFHSLKFILFTQWQHRRCRAPIPSQQVVAVKGHLDESYNLSMLVGKSVPLKSTRIVRLRTFSDTKKKTKQIQTIFNEGQINAKFKKLLTPTRNASTMSWPYTLFPPPSRCGFNTYLQNN